MLYEYGAYQSKTIVPATSTIPASIVDTAVRADGCASTTAALSVGSTSGYPSGIRLAFAASQVSKSCSSGLSVRTQSMSRAPKYCASKSRLNWNMFPRSSAPGKPKLR